MRINKLFKSYFESEIHAYKVIFLVLFIFLNQKAFAIDSAAYLYTQTSGFSATADWSGTWDSNLSIPVNVRYAPASLKHADIIWISSECTTNQSNWGIYLVFPKEYKDGIYSYKLSSDNASDVSGSSDYSYLLLYNVRGGNRCSLGVSNDQLNFSAGGAAINVKPQTGLPLGSYSVTIPVNIIAIKNMAPSSAGWGSSVSGLSNYQSMTINMNINNRCDVVSNEINFSYGSVDKSSLLSNPERVDNISVNCQNPANLKVSYSPSSAVNSDGMSTDLGNGWMAYLKLASSKVNNYEMKSFSQASFDITSHIEEQSSGSGEVGAISGSWVVNFEFE